VTAKRQQWSLHKRKAVLDSRGNVIRAAGMLGSAVSIAITFGCQRPREAIESPPPYRHEAWNTADSPAICAQVQKCFQSNVAIVVCRELEDDAIQISRTPTQPADNGAANALRY
jgi:hypothetical protein